MKIYPSILSADFVNLQMELETIDNADAIHVDIMDNNFVPNLTFGQPMVKRLLQVAKLPLDLHLMISRADYWAPKFAELGPASVTFHFEASDSPLATIRKIKETGANAAIAIKPATPVSLVSELLAEVDMLLVMTVEPGFGGQELIPQTLEKVREAAADIKNRNLKVEIEVDGGVTAENIAEISRLGASVFVAGSAVFGHQDRRKQVELLRVLARS